MYREWKHSGQWDEVPKVAEQVSEGRDSHSALSTNSPPTGLPLILRTLETTITSHF